MSTLLFDRTAFRPIACVDWVKLRVRLTRPSEGGKLKGLLEIQFGVSHADPEDAGPGNAASVFVLTVQTSANFQSLSNLMQFLSLRYGLQSEPHIVAIEISIDWKPAVYESQTLDAMTKHLMKSIMPPISNNPRMTKDWRDLENYTLPHKRGIETDRTLYIGNENDDLLWRSYFKRTNDTYSVANGQRIAKPLPTSDHCARVEVRIKGEPLEKLGLVRLSDLLNFKFEKLQKLRLLRFGKPANPGQQIAQNKYAAVAMAALCIDDLAPACVLNKFGHRDSRGRALDTGKSVVVDTELTESARCALRTLTQRFSKQKTKNSVAILHRIE